MIYAVLWFCLLAGLYIGLYLLNKRTPEPEGCVKMEACRGCANVACTKYERGDDR